MCNDVHVHLFTDGSCLFQSQAAYRFAAYAVIEARLDHPVRGSNVWDTGPLPGVLQTAYRAEIFAVLRAIQHARLRKCSATIWSDCDGVVKRVRKLLRGCPPRINSLNFDLWHQVFQEIRDAVGLTFDITRVAAHQVLGKGTEFEDWCFVHNQIADRTAVRTNHLRPPSFWQFFNKHVAAVHAAQNISLEVQNTILRISKAIVQCDSHTAAAERVEKSLPDAEGFWTGLVPLSALAPEVTRWYSIDIVRKILSWFHQTLHDSREPVVWVSQIHLYLDFQMSTGCVGPANIQGWVDGDDIPFFSLAEHPCRKRVRWFCKVLRETLRKCNQPFSCKFGCPTSHALRLHTGTIALPWPGQRLEWIDKWILQHIPTGVRRVSSAVDHLPIAARDARFDEIFLSGLL